MLPSLTIWLSLFALPLCFLLAGAKTAPAGEEQQRKDQRQELAKPLRKFDVDRDGRLTGEELVLARQEHNRGGRGAEPNPDRWKDQLNRMKGDWRRRRMAELDRNHDGALDEAEKTRANELWAKIAAGHTALRLELTRKYDRDDDGELNERERNEARRETDQRRAETESAVMAAALASP